MKRCPTCQGVYTDDSLTYCLQDGSLLAVVSDAGSSENVTWQMSSAGRSSGSEPPTEILNPEDMPTVRIEAPQTKEQQRARPTAFGHPQQAAPGTAAGAPRSNATVIALSVVVALLLVALGGLITWIMLRDKGGAQQGATNPAAPRTSASPEASAAPQSSPADVSAAQREVQAVLDGWAESIRQRNLEEHMKYYADVLDVYYNSTNVSKERVRADRSLAFSKYSSLDMQLSKVTITVEPSGTRAVATFDKTFDFRGEKNFSGSGLNRFWLSKTGGRWRITGEKDLRNYYINK